MLIDETPAKSFRDEDYSAQFIFALGAEFDFDGANPEIVDEINYIRNGYIASKRVDGLQAYDKEARRDYLELKTGIDEFFAKLNKHGAANSANDMYFGALYLREQKPQTEFSEITDFEKTRGKPYYLELMRLLRILGKGIDRNIEYLAPPRGRRPDYAIQTLVRRAAEFWVGYLDRNFTVDYHKGAGLTPAFEFVKMLALEIDEAITDTKIITVMRTEIAERNGSNTAR